MVQEPPICDVETVGVPGREPRPSHRRLPGIPWHRRDDDRRTGRLLFDPCPRGCLHPRASHTRLPSPIGLRLLRRWELAQSQPGGSRPMDRGGLELACACQLVPAALAQTPRQGPGGTRGTCRHRLDDDRCHPSSCRWRADRLEDRFGSPQATRIDLHRDRAIESMWTGAQRPASRKTLSVDERAVRHDARRILVARVSRRMPRGQGHGRFATRDARTCAISVGSNCRRGWFDTGRFGHRHDLPVCHGSASQTLAQIAREGPWQSPGTPRRLAHHKLGSRGLFAPRNPRGWVVGPTVWTPGANLARR